MHSYQLKQIYNLIKTQKTKWLKNEILQRNFLEITEDLNTNELPKNFCKLFIFLEEKAERLTTKTPLLYRILITSHQQDKSREQQIQLTETQIFVPNQVINHIKKTLTEFEHKTNKYTLFDLQIKKLKLEIIWHQKPLSNDTQ